MAKFASIKELYHAFKTSTGISIDTRTLKAGELFFALSGPNFDGNQYAQKALDCGARMVVVDDESVHADLSLKQSLLVKDSLKSLQDLSTFHRNEMSSKIFALTGSNGKTTTKELIAKVLQSKYTIIATKGNLNNHIGVPLTLLDIKPETEIAIIEMGANHVGEIALLSSIALPDAGLITNIGEAHLEGFGSLEGIKKGKGELFKYLIKANGDILLNQDESFLSELVESYKNTIVYDNSTVGNWSIRFENADVDQPIEIIATSKGNEIKLTLGLYGEYNYPNIMAALNVGDYFGVEFQNALEAVAAYKSTNKRSEIMVTERNRIVLDAYNANPSSMRAAISAFDRQDSNKKVMILGDMFELGDQAQKLHQEIADLTKPISATTFLIGSHFKKCQSEAQHFIDVDALKSYLEQQPITDALVLIKGSRGMALEQIVSFL